ncbi:MAG TPA: hypothetical protein VF483_03975 [Gemmatimonadaceae bacterium]
MNRTLAAVVCLGAAGLLGSCHADASDSPTHLAFVGQPTATVATNTFNARVVLLTADGRVASGSILDVAVGLPYPNQSVHVAGITTVRAGEGEADFALSIAKAGAGYRLVAKAAGLDSAVSDPFDVAVGPPERVQFGNVAVDSIILFPVPGPNDLFYSPAGSSNPVTVSVTDAGGNPVSGPSYAVTIGFSRFGNSVGQTVAEDGLFGTTTLTTTNGSATFSDLTFHKIGDYVFTASVATLPLAISAKFRVCNAPLSRLIFFTQPSGGQANIVIAPFSVIQADSFGNGLAICKSATGAPGTPSLGFGANPAGATLSGTLTGFNFADIVIDKPGSGFTLVAASGAWTVTSAPFNITP